MISIYLEVLKTPLEKCSLTNESRLKKCIKHQETPLKKCKAGGLYV